MAVNQFTNVLTLVWALLDDVAIVLEKVVDEEFVEICGRRVVVLVDFSSQGLAEN